jgi:uncharacterized Zn finger protein
MAKPPKKKANQQEMVTLRSRAEVFRNLEFSIGEIARLANVDPATVRRMKTGKPIRRTSGNKVARAIKELTKNDIDPAPDLVESN